jgi:hypothetical protein
VLTAAWGLDVGKKGVIMRKADLLTWPGFGPNFRRGKEKAKTARVANAGRIFVNPQPKWILRTFFTPALMIVWDKVYETLYSRRWWDSLLETALGRQRLGFSFAMHRDNFLYPRLLTAWLLERSTSHTRFSVFGIGLCVHCYAYVQTDWVTSCTLYGHGDVEYYVRSDDCLGSSPAVPTGLKAVMAFNNMYLPFLDIMAD